MYYAKSTSGFYSREISGDKIPPDAVEITDEYYAALLSGQSAGKVIAADETGYPTLENAPALPPQVPAIVTMRQARLALHASGLLAGVEAAIESLEDPPKTEARIEWDFSSEVHRNKPFVEMLTAALGLTEQEVDDLFTLAATL